MKVGVIGSGSIGPDLAYGFLSALAPAPGSQVFLVDIRQEALDAGVARIRGYLKKGMSRGKISAKAASAIEAALTPTLSLSDLADCEYVLEAASETLSVKLSLLAELEQVVSPSCLIGFATSGLPRAQIVQKAVHPERCFVNHPFFPAWRSLPVEVVSSGHAEFEARMSSTLKALGKVPVPTADVACFAADDIFCNYISEAARIVEEGIATPAQVDKIVNDAIGGGGPFNVMDATRGNLLTVHCQQLMQEAESGTPWFRAPGILTSKGNQSWHDGKSSGAAPVEAAVAQTVLDRILAVLVGRTYFVLDHAICEPADLDWMTRMALGFSQGLVSLAEELGAARVHELCTGFARQFPEFPIPESIARKKLVSFRRNVRIERQGDVAIVRVWRPEVKNALSARTIAEIDAAMRELEVDRTVKGVVLTSYDGALAGADIGELAALPNPEACRKICLDAHSIMLRISAMTTPVVAAVRGPVLGGGAELAMCCHARVVGPDLVLGQPEVNLGIIPGYGGTQRLPRLIGVERAVRLMRTGGAIGAKQAVEWGWATGAPTADVESAAIELLRSGRKLEAVATAKMAVPESWAPVDIGHRSLAIDGILLDVLRQGLQKPLAQGLEVEAEGFARCKATVDMDIGMKNFTQNGPRVPALFLHE